MYRLTTASGAVSVQLNATVEETVLFATGLVMLTVGVKLLTVTFSAPLPFEMPLT